MPQTIKQLLAIAVKQIDILDAEILLAYSIGKTKEYILSHHDVNIGFLERIKFNFFVKKRCAGIPLAYITKHKEFFGLNFTVNKYTLIPRPDTEVLIETVLNDIKKNSPQNINYLLIDIGTGSGCIPISILKNSKNKNFETFATDISSHALKIAKQNTEKHNLKINFLHGSLLEPILASGHHQIKKYEQIIITANLPYLTEEQFRNEKSIQHEPKSALVANKEGLELYEQLLYQIAQMSKTYNLKPITYIEIDPAQTQKITELINEILPKFKIEIAKDLCKLDRVVTITNTAIQ